MIESKEAVTRREGQVEELKMYPSYKDLEGIDGETIEFEWNLFPGFSSLQILQEIERDLERKNVKPQELTDRISCQCSTTLIGQKEEKNEGFFFR